jgi:hypothetical protein
VKIYKVPKNSSILLKITLNLNYLWLATLTIDKVFFGRGEERLLSVLTLTSLVKLKVPKFGWEETIEEE